MTNQDIPVYDQRSERIGTVVNWEQRDGQLVITADITSMPPGVVFSHPLSLDGWFEGMYDEQETTDEDPAQEALDAEAAFRATLGAGTTEEG